MRNSVVGAAALAVAVIASSAAFAGDRSPSRDDVERSRNPYQNEGVTYGYGNHAAAASSSSVTVVRLGDLTRGARGHLLGTSSAASREALQARIASDAALADELRAHGVQINNVVGAVNAPNGKTVVYVR